METTRRVRSRTPRKADKSENIANEGDLPPEQRRGDHDKDDKNGNDKK